jgi:hypothetical protein
MGTCSQPAVVTRPAYVLSSAAPQALPRPWTAWARRDTLRDADFFGSAPLAAAFVRATLASIRAFDAAAGSFDAIAVRTALICVRTALLMPRLRRVRFAR